jgi:HEAT repeats
MCQEQKWTACMLPMGLFDPANARIPLHGVVMHCEAGARFGGFAHAGSRSLTVNPSNCMRTYLMDLLERLSMPEPGVSSADSISWHAHREAEQLRDLALVADLDEFLSSNPPARKRTAAYFIVGAIGKNCGSGECASMLIKYASSEKDKYALHDLLDRLAEIPKPNHIDLEPLFALLEDQRWLVRHAAIRSLMNVSSPEPEVRLLALLGSTTDPHDLIYCHATLNRIGTAKSLAALRSNLTSRKRDVKLSAAAAIDAIEARIRAH